MSLNKDCRLWTNIVDDKISDLIGEGVITLTSFGFKLDIAKIKSQNNPKAYLYRFLNEYGFKTAIHTFLKVVNKIPCMLKDMSSNLSNK